MYFYGLCLKVYGIVVYSCGDRIFAHFVGFLSLGMLVPNSRDWLERKVTEFYTSQITP